MDSRKIAGRAPFVGKLAAGTYWWCRCGRSQNQPFCDGSHAGTGLEPVEVVVEEEKKVALCLCKRTGNEPYCDGTHKTLPAN